MLKRPTLLFLIYFFCILKTKAQDPITSFEKISLSDFSVTPPLQGKDAGALVLSDIGSTELEGDDEGFKMVFTRTRKVKILNTKGFHAAKVELYFSADDNGTKKLKTLKANTYNLENGSITTTHVADSDFYIEKEDGEIQKETFAFPNVKEGSIIEYTFTIKSSRLLKLQPWDFQEEYPVLLSAYTVKIPDIFNYVFLKQGNHPFFNQKTDSVNQTIVAGTQWFKTSIHTISWVMKDIEPIRTAPFISSLDNYVNRIQFQLSMKPIAPNKSETVLRDWTYVCNRLLNSESFGEIIKSTPGWLTDEVKFLTRECNSETERAKKIFGFVRDNFTADQRSIFFSSGLTLKDIYKRRSGNTADINMLLISMLKCAHINADPVILSTRDNGLTNVQYPIMDKFNYIVCKTSLDGKNYFLDATHHKIGFGKLPLECYNGHAQVICENTYPVFLIPDSLKETKITSIYVYNDSTNKMSIDYNSTPGYYESYKLRTEINTEKPTEYFKEISKSYITENSISTSGIDSPNNYDESLNIHYSMQLEQGNPEIIYFNPMFTEAIKENPFKSDSLRNYSVEMPYTTDNIYSFNMEMPQGYTIDELPKPVKIMLNNNEGMFEYAIKSVGNRIQLRSRVSFSKATFYPEDYQSLRNFYTLIVNKQSEFIVLRRLSKK